MPRGKIDTPDLSEAKATEPLFDSEGKTQWKISGVAQMELKKERPTVLSFLCVDKRGLSAAVGAILEESGSPVRGRLKRLLLRWCLPASEC